MLLFALGQWHIHPTSLSLNVSYLTTKLCTDSCISITTYLCRASTITPSAPFGLLGGMNQDERALFLCERERVFVVFRGVLEEVFPNAYGALICQWLLLSFAKCLVGALNRRHSRRG